MAAIKKYHLCPDCHKYIPYLQSRCDCGRRFVGSERMFKTCPACGLLVCSSKLLCDCGHFFLFDRRAKVSNQDVDDAYSAGLAAGMESERKRQEEARQILSRLDPGTPLYRDIQHILDSDDQTRPSYAYRPEAYPAPPPRRKSHQLPVILLIIIISVAAVFSVWAFHRPPASADSSASPALAPPSPSVTEIVSSPAPSSAPGKSLLEQAIDENRASKVLHGQIIENTVRTPRLAPFTVKTVGSGNYYILLKSISDSSSRIGFYVQGGKTLDTEVPLGDYSIYYASGDTWYGSTSFFGDGTTFTRCSGLFDFYYDDTNCSYEGYTLTLYPVYGGNMNTKTVSLDEFIQ